MPCFSCGASFDKTEKERVEMYKDLYRRTKEISYFYRLKPGGTLFIVRSNSFKGIFEKQIKPNFANGAEYARIDEYPD